MEDVENEDVEYEVPELVAESEDNFVSLTISKVWAIMEEIVSLQVLVV